MKQQEFILRTAGVNTHGKKSSLGVEKAWTLDGKIKYKRIDYDRIDEFRSAGVLSKLMERANMDQ